MKAFEVHVNGERVGTAKFMEGVTTVIVDHVPGRGLCLHIGSLEAFDEVMEWSSPEAAVGAEVTVRIVEADGVDLPANEHRRVDPIGEQRNDDQAA